VVQQTAHPIRTIRAHFIEARGTYPSPTGRIYGSNPVPVIHVQEPLQYGRRPYTGYGFVTRLCKSRQSSTWQLCADLIARGCQKIGVRQGWYFTTGLIKKDTVILSVDPGYVNVHTSATGSGRNIHRSQKRCKRIFGSSGLAGRSALILVLWFAWLPTLCGSPFCS